MILVPASPRRTLRSSEFASVEDALARIAPSSAMTCGSDAGVLTLDLTEQGTVSLYADDFYSGCPSGVLVGRAFVTGLQQLNELLHNLGTE